RVCVQAGGHAGMWPMRLASQFQKIHTFEPEEALFNCLKNNCASFPNVVVHQQALGDVKGTVQMVASGTAGSWRVDPAGEVSVEQIRIDDLNLLFCDLIVLDVEGYEPQALHGAVETIKRCRPVLHLELLPRARDAISL